MNTKAEVRSLARLRGTTVPSPVRDGVALRSAAARRPVRFSVTSGAARASFRKGLQSSRIRGREREALVYFESALILDVFHRHGDALPRYRSYYGLALALVCGKLARGLELCRDACRESGYDAELFLNLGRLERKVGNRREAHRALTRGYHLADGKEVFEEHLRRLDLGVQVTPAGFSAPDTRAHPRQVTSGH